MLCCVASLVAESDAISSSSLIPVTVAPSPAMFRLVFAVTVVPVIAAAELPPITVPSMVPASMSAVSATKESMLAVPSMNKSCHSEPTAPRSCVPSALGIRSLATSAVIVTVSVAASPIVVLPLSAVVPVTVRLVRVRFSGSSAPAIWKLVPS